MKPINIMFLLRRTKNTKRLSFIFLCYTSRRSWDSNRPRGRRDGYRPQVRPHGIGGAVGGSTANISAEPRGDVGLPHGVDVEHVLLAADMEDALADVLLRDLLQQKSGHILRGEDGRLETEGSGCRRDEDEEYETVTWLYSSQSLLFHQ